LPRTTPSRQPSPPQLVAVYDGPRTARHVVQRAALHQCVDARFAEQDERSPIVIANAASPGPRLGAPTATKPTMRGGRPHRPLREAERPSGRPSCGADPRPPTAHTPRIDRHWRLRLMLTNQSPSNSLNGLRLIVSNPLKASAIIWCLAPRGNLRSVEEISTSC
jgi:hypothetical protein